MEDKKFVKCRYCGQKLSRPVTLPENDYQYVDHCTYCKRYLFVTLHPNGKSEMIECQKDYEPKHTKSLQQQY